MSQEFYSLIVSRVVEETADSRSFVFEIPVTLRERFAYQAGQFLTFEIPWEGFAIRRCYSLASAPRIDSAPKVTVKRVEGGRMSNWMVDRLKAGDTIRVSPPDGRFVLVADAGDAPLTLFAGGSGITPVISLMKTALVTTGRDVSLVYANRDAASIIFRAELDAIVREYPARVRVHHHLDAEGGFLTQDRVRGFLEGREHGDVYVCGPTPFMDTVERALEAAGVSEARAHFERFLSPADLDRRAASTAEVESTEVPETFLLRLDRKNHVVPYTRGLTLLAAAKAFGVRAPSSCEDGFCGSCMSQLVRGDVKMAACTALSDKEIAKGRVLMCQSRPTSAAPLEVDYDATSFRLEQKAATSGSSQPLIPRVLASIFVILVMLAFFLFRTKG